MDAGDIVEPDLMNLVGGEICRRVVGQPLLVISCAVVEPPYTVAFYTQLLLALHFDYQVLRKRARRAESKR